jgi:hypothetical protein
LIIDELIVTMVLEEKSLTKAAMQHNPGTYLSLSKAMPFFSSDCYSGWKTFKLDQGAGRTLVEPHFVFVKSQDSAI